MKTSSRIAWIVCVTSCISCLTVATRAQVCLPEFAEQPGFAVGRNAGTSALADLNEDGNLDLIVGHIDTTDFDGNGLTDVYLFQGGADRFELPWPGAFRCGKDLTDDALPCAYDVSTCF